MSKSLLLQKSPRASFAPKWCSFFFSSFKKEMNRSGRKNMCWHGESQLWFQRCFKWLHLLPETAFWKNTGHIAVNGLNNANSSTNEWFFLSCAGSDEINKSWRLSLVLKGVTSRTRCSFPRSTPHLVTNGTYSPCLVSNVVSWSIRGLLIGFPERKWKESWGSLKLPINSVSGQMITEARVLRCSWT